MDTSTERAGPLVVRVAKACAMLDCSKTRLYELMSRGEIDSFIDGKMRKCIVPSIHAYIERRRAVERQVA